MYELNIYIFVQNLSLILYSLLITHHDYNHFFFFFLGNAGYQTQGLAHDRQALVLHWTTPPVPNYLSIIHTSGRNTGTNNTEFSNMDVHITWCFSLPMFALTGSLFTGFFPPSLIQQEFEYLTVSQAFC